MFAWTNDIRTASWVCKRGLNTRSVLAFPDFWRDLLRGKRGLVGSCRACAISGARRWKRPSNLVRMSNYDSYGTKLLSIRAEGNRCCVRFAPVMDSSSFKVAFHSHNWPVSTMTAFWRKNIHKRLSQLSKISRSIWFQVSVLEEYLELFSRLTLYNRH